MHWAELKNLKAIPISSIPVLETDQLVVQLKEHVAQGKRVLQFFGDDSSGKVLVYAVLAEQATSMLFVAAMDPGEKKSYPSMTPDVPAMHLFERELFEQFAIKPEGHPWLKPVRKGIAGIDETETQYPFFAMQGEEVHEVGVGPIHAGIIEPGHFRFSCHGETVYHLEIELGFQHRGIESLFISQRERVQYLLKLAESIAGDTVIGHAGTFVRAMESLSGTKPAQRTSQIRTIALELERIAVHLGDLSALAGDVAYLTGNATFGALRTKVINTTLALCGSRFGRGLLTIGGVKYDIDAELQKHMQALIGQWEEEIETAAEVLFSSASVLSRFDHTGIVSMETAESIGMVGPAARASGLAQDIRADFPFGTYNTFPVHAITLQSGDVFARAYIRYIEITQSLRILREQLEHLHQGSIQQEIKPALAEHFVVSLAEAWRGEVAHVAMTDAKGLLKRYKIKDPSFHNWLGLALALRNEGISDFPVCNKSFNLSYCGFDL